MKPINSIHDKLVFRIGLSLSIVLLILFFAIMTSQKEAIIAKHRTVATTMVQTAIIPINDALYLAGSENDDFLQSFLKNFVLEYQDEIKFALILGEGGRVIAHSDISQINDIYSDVYSNSALESLDPQFHIYRDNQLGGVMEISAPLGLITLSHGAVRLGLDSQPLENELRSTMLFIIGMILLTLVLVIFIVLRISRSVTRGLRHTAEAIDAIDFQTSEPLELLEADDEIGLLNDRFKRLQERLINTRSSMEITNKNLVQTEKLAAMGRMAAGVAHEINNPLLGLKNCLHLLHIDPENQADHIRLLKDGLDRIEIIVSRLLEGARKKTGTIKDYDFNRSVRDVLNLVGHRLSKEKIITQVHLNDSIPPVYNNKSGFEEALLNICMNALDAIGSVGTIHLETEIRGNNVAVVVGDSGPGIASEEGSRMFEPFVTSKEVGKGTGLGLYVSREIIGAMGGEISYSTSDLGGAEFTIELPIRIETDEG
ncbi:MAG: hypothetical protein HQ556_05960 [Candidatus Marinimicrobia bacterium]|nr:hypothetical protein [Candidatus Neomarinimicrobiota bacterium]